MLLVAPAPTTSDIVLSVLGVLAALLSGGGMIAKVVLLLRERSKYKAHLAELELGNSEAKAQRVDKEAGELRRILLDRVTTLEQQKEEREHAFRELAEKYQELAEKYQELVESSRLQQRHLEEAVADKEQLQRHVRALEQARRAGSDARPSVPVPPRIKR